MADAPDPLWHRNRKSRVIPEKNATKSKEDDEAFREVHEK